MGFFSDLFNRETKEAPQPRIKETPWSQQNRGFLQNLVGREVNLPVRPVAGASSAQQTGQGILADVLAGKSFEDPASSQYWQGLRGTMNQNTESGLAQMRRYNQRAGMGYSSPAARAEGNYLAASNNQANTLLGSLYNQERQRDNPYTRMQAAFSYGDLERQLAQQELDAQYQAAMGNIQFPYQYQAPIANSLLGYQPWYQPSFYTQPSGMEKFTDYLNQWFGPSDAIGSRMLPMMQMGGY
jgi:hypothetical protein